MDGKFGEERSRLRGAYVALGLLLLVPLAWAALRGFPAGFFFYLPFAAGVCVVLHAIEATVRSLRARIEELEKRLPPESPEPPRLPHGYDPGARDRR